MRWEAMIFAFIKPSWHFPVISISGLACADPSGVRRAGLFSRIPPLLIFEKAFFGAAAFLGRERLDFVGCIFGALIGAKLLAWMEAPGLYWLCATIEFLVWRQNHRRRTPGRLDRNRNRQESMGITSSTGDLVFIR